MLVGLVVMATACGAATFASYALDNYTPLARCNTAVDLREMSTGIRFDQRFIDGRCFIRTPGTTGRWKEIEP